MSGLEFLNQLESLGVLDAETVGRLRSKVSRPGKTISAGRVAKYLVEKGELTATQADRFLSQLQEAEPSGGGNELMMLSEADVVEEPIEEIVDLAAAAEMPAAVEDLGLDALAQADVLGAQGAGIEDEPTRSPEDEEKERRRFEAKKVLENRWESKWMIVGPTLVIVLAMAAAFLYFVLTRRGAEDLLETASKSYRNQSYAEAIENYDKFLRSYPRHPAASMARVRQGISQIRSNSDSSNWERALDALPEVLPQIEEEEAFADEGRPELTSILPKIALGFVAQAERASDVERKEALVARSQAAMEFVGNSMYLPTSARRQVQGTLDELVSRLETVTRDIQREKKLVAVIQAMDTAIGEDDTSRAFEVRKDLIREFPVLEGEPRLVDASKRTAEHERGLVRNDTPALVVSESLPATDATASVVLATRVGQAVPELEGQLYPLLTRGSVYMINASSGEVLWRQFVGYETSIQPQWVNERGGDIILADQQSHQVLRVEGRSGRLVWRTEVGEPFGPLTLTKDSVFVSTSSGRVVQLAIGPDPTNNIAGGQAVDGAVIPQSLSVGAASDRTGKYIYQAGLQSNLYILSPGEGNEPMKCEEVYYLGHRNGSINVTPVLTQGLLFVVENSGNDFALLHVLKPKNRGLELEPAQAPIRLRGEVLAALELYGRRGLLTLTDQGEIKLWEVELVEEGEDPVKEIATFDRKTEPGTYSFYLAEKGRLWVGDAGVTAFEVQAQRGLLDRTNAYDAGDRFVAPFGLFGDTLVQARIRAGSQLVSVSAVSVEDHAEIWRTDLAASLAGSPHVEIDGSVVAITSQGDQYLIDQPLLDQGVGTVPRKRGSSTEQDLVFSTRVDLGQGRVLCFGPPAKTRVLGIDPAQSVNSTALSDSSIPAGTLAFKPLAMGNRVLAGSTEGPVFLLDAFRGQSGETTPFQPAVAPGKTINWLRPAVIDENRFVIAEAAGELYSVVRQGNGLAKQSQVAIEGTFVSPLAAIGDQVFAAVVVDGQPTLMRFAADNLAAGGELPLPAAVTFGPVAAGELILIGTADENLHAVKADGTLAWSLPVSGSYPVGVTLADSDRAIVSLASGYVLVVSLADGTVSTTLTIGEPLYGNPMLQAGQLYVPGADGTIYFVVLPSN